MTTDRIVKVFFMLVISFLFCRCSEKETRIYRFPDGSTQSTFELIDGKKNGVATYYYPNGNVQAIHNYVNDTVNGMSNYYSISGRISKRISYEKGKKDGDYQVYYTNGNIAESGKFRQDLKLGKVLQYFETDSGAVQYEYYMMAVKDAQEIYYKKEYDQQGNLQETKRYMHVFVDQDSTGSADYVLLRLTIPEKVKFDSAIAIYGDYTWNFIPAGTLDTITFLDHTAEIRLRKKDLANVVRGECIIYRKETDADSTYEYSSSRHFEESIFVK
jgi:hypothetical protein